MTSSNNKKRTRSKSFRFEVRLVPPEAYPDLATNPMNPFAQMTDEERQEGFTDFLGLIWAETCREESKAVNISCNYTEKVYDDTRSKTRGGDYVQKVA